MCDRKKKQIPRKFLLDLLKHYLVFKRKSFISPEQKQKNHLIDLVIFSRYSKNFIFTKKTHKNLMSCFVVKYEFFLVRKSDFNGRELSDN